MPLHPPPYQFQSYEFAHLADDEPVNQNLQKPPPTPTDNEP